MKGSTLPATASAAGISTRAPDRKIAKKTPNMISINVSPALVRHEEGMSPENFAARCHQIVTDQRGHAAHRALDLLTNDLLRGLGYGDGIDVFEVAVGHWHDEADPYPGGGACPDCARADAGVTGEGTAK
jgi:hypothetical protein